MTAAKSKVTSRILEAVHETATDLSNAGFIGADRMQQYDDLCRDPSPARPDETADLLRTKAGRTA